MTSLVSQFIAFAVMIGSGLVVGLLFDMYRVVRSLIRPRSKSSIVMDLLFWALITPVFFAMLLAGNWGELRLYVFLGVGVGLFAYFQLASPIVLWSLITFARWLGRITAATIYAVMRLVGAPVRIWRDVRTACWRLQVRIGSRLVLRMPKIGFLRPKGGASWHKPGWLSPSIRLIPLRVMPPWGRVWPFWRK